MLKILSTNDAYRIFQIRRMQDILAQMQEKLKATGQITGNVGLRGRVGSLGNDLDATDVDKKRSSIIDV